MTTLTNSLPASSTRVPGIILKLAASALIIAYYTGVTASLAVSDRTFLIALAVIGLFICGAGPLSQGQRYGWFGIRHLSGYVLGLAGMAALLAAMLGWLAAGTAITVLVMVILAKILVGFTYARR